MTNLIEIYTDGACSQNGTWEGGWGYCIGNMGHMGYSEKTTNNRMELTAVIKALEEISTWTQMIETRVIIYTDSSYVANAYNKKWINNWKRNGWKNSKKEEVKNKDLWIILDALVTFFDKVEFVKVKGHSGILGNERADKLATTAMKNKIKKTERRIFETKSVVL